MTTPSGWRRRGSRTETTDRQVARCLSLSPLLPRDDEAHGMMPILLPSRLERDPAVVHETLAHLDEREARGMRRGDMSAHEVGEGLERHGPAPCAAEVPRP